MTREIKAAARQQLAESGAAALSLRAVARELGMVSSALYRYFPSRDELLTALIIDAYVAVGGAAAEAESAVKPQDLLGRWLATVRAVRSWALDNPQEYALIFGSPVPGYAAPTDTIDPAARIPLLIISIVTDAAGAATGPAASRADEAVPAPVKTDLRTLGDTLAPALDERQLGKAVMAWTQLIGLISFELFGHLHNVIHDYPAHFEYQMRVVAADLGLGTQ